jgi:hypothetical protein
MSLVSIHQHFNLRKICDLDLDAVTEGALARPPPLKDRRKGDPHEVRLKTTQGTLVLFRVKGNGIPYVVTPTPAVAVAMASGAAAIVK